MNRGVLAATVAYLLWGMFPLYIKLLSAVPTLQLLAHRAMWCAVIVWLWLALHGEASWWRRIDAHTLWTLTFTAVLVSFNWGLYIWAINAGHVIETSLGYYMTPLVSVLFGVLLLRERPTRWQWLAIAAAAFGVASLAFASDRLPWIALGLAFSFGTYGLVRKLLPVEALEGLGFESGLLFLPCLGYLLWCELQGTGAFAHLGIANTLLIVAAGAVTATPLALFTYAARRIPMVTLGFLQYIAPTLQLLLGVFVYLEPFGSDRMIAFGCIWFGLAIYSIESIVRQLRGGARAPGKPGSASG
ncbi:MAG: EamA family transporter RarD [Steroidobacteraceae bacterium]